MRWSVRNKKKLQELFWEKKEKLRKEREDHYEAWLFFLESFGIVEVRREWGSKHWRQRGTTAASSLSLLTESNPLNIDEYDARSATNKHQVLIEHTFWSIHGSWMKHEWGLKISKEVAEKFLVLGVP
jgi:hypothetical protein